MKNEDLQQLEMLADPIQDFIVDRNTILFYKSGKSYEIIVRKDASLGLVVCEENKEKLADLPLLKYVKDRLIGFPTLAEQIVKHVEKKKKDQQINFVKSPLRIDNCDYEDSVDAIKKRFCEDLPPFSTGLIQLMAPAGQGKSVMLDEVSYDLAKNYSGENPLMLNIDLLGRYVGSIEDAIAGALNNVYYFPMSQREIVYAIRKGWVVLALDGFDELVARVGPKDAFLKLTSLIDQLNGCGYLLISARETFFESIEIKFSSQAYLKPLVGSFEKINSELKSWGTVQRRALIQAYMRNNKINQNVDKICQDIDSLFDNDKKLLENPFFLTKIIEWYFEEQFSMVEMGKFGDSFSRIQRVIEKYVEREALKKWLDRDGNPISTIEDHRNVLGCIAEEIFRSSMQHLSGDELKICTEIALESSKCDPFKIESFSNKIMVHSVFSVNDSQYAFTHIQFSNYYLATRLLNRILNVNFADLGYYYADKDLPKEVITWLNWLLKKESIDISKTLPILINELKKVSSPFLRNNISKLIVSVLNGRDGTNYEICNLMLIGDDLNNVQLKNIIITKSEMNQLDLTSSELYNVRIRESMLSYIKFGNKERYTQFNIDEKTEINGISLENGEEIYSPTQINNRLCELGFMIISKKCFDIEKNIPDNIKEVVAKMISKSNKHYYFSKEELEEEAGNSVYAIVDVGIRHGIFNEKNNGQRALIKIVVDKQMLIEGAEKNVLDNHINEFWNDVISTS